MEPISPPRKKPLSKYVLSNVLLFLPPKAALALRQTSKAFDEASWVAFGCLFHEMQEQAEKFEFILDTQFDQQTQKEHKELSQKELIINKALKEYIQDANKSDNLFKNFK